MPFIQKFYHGNYFVFSLQFRRCTFNPWVRKIPWRRAWQSTPVFLPGKSYGQSSLPSYSPWFLKELEKNELLTNTFTFHLLTVEHWSFSDKLIWKTWHPLKKLLVHFLNNRSLWRWHWCLNSHFKYKMTSTGHVIWETSQIIFDMIIWEVSLKRCCVITTRDWHISIFSMILLSYLVCSLWVAAYRSLCQWFKNSKCN